MINIYSSEKNFSLALGREVRAAELAYCKQQQIPTYRLMQRAGLALWQLIDQKFPQANALLIIAGSGNNAGDGFEVAHHAFKAGKNVRLRFVAKEENSQKYCQSFKGDAAIALQNLQQTSVEISPLEDKDLLGVELIIDALLGTGIKAPARQQFNQAIQKINQSGISVLSVDVPSGLDADLGCEVGVAVRADVTLSFIALKPGLVTAMGKECCGELFLDRLDVDNLDAFSKTRRELTSLFNPRKKLSNKGLFSRSTNSHKGDFGRTLIIGGNLGMGGAAILAAGAACRAGSGAVMMITRPQHIAATLAQYPEVMVIGTDSGVDSESGELALKVFNSATTIVIGPGLGTDDWAEFWLRKSLSTDVKKVVDADGLRIAKKLNLSLAETIITPHPGEAAALLENTTTADVQNDRYKSIKALQQQTKATVILKGAGTLIADKTGIKVCPYGNSGMATAGMGDVLAGILGGLLSQGMAQQQAAVIGTLMHSLAGDRAAAEKPIGMMATDLLDEIRQIRNDLINYDD